MKIIFASLPNFGQFNIAFTIANKLTNEINEKIIFMTGDDRKHIIKSNNNIEFISMGKMETMSNINPELIYNEKKSPDMFIESEVFLKYILSKDSYEEPFKKMETFIKKDNDKYLLIIDVLTFFALDIAYKYNIPFVVLCPIDPSNFFVSKLPWKYPSILEPYGCNSIDIIKHKIELNLYTIYNLIFRGLGNNRINLTGTFNSPEKILRSSKGIICSNIWGVVEPFDHPYNLHMVGSIIENEKFNKNNEIIKWINEDNKNVILVSFGSIANLNFNIINNLRIAFKNIVEKYNVKILWKLKNNINNLDINCKNIKIIEWIPSMKQLLNSRKVILNIHHGGANSFQEALYYGIPQIIIPFWSDCYGIARRCKEIGLGLTINNSRNFNIKEIEYIIETMLTNENYTKTSKFWKKRCLREGGLDKAIDIIKNVLNDILEE